MRVAIVGSGVSGLVAARLLHREHAVTVFEADDRIGGHVHTWQLPAGGRSWAVDSGFIVYNERNYPQFSRLLATLGVASQPSSMGFSLRCERTGREYNGSSLGQLFVQRRNLLRPSFLRMLADIVRFNRQAPRALADGRAGHPVRAVAPGCAPAPGPSLGALLDAGRYSAAFREHYLIPMAAAVWSLPAARVLEMPAAFLVRFFENHGMLSLGERPAWRVIQGGSQRYIEALVAPFRAAIRLASRVRRVRRLPEHVDIDGEAFDRVVFACHSDQALALLADPSAAEREVLGALHYQRNDVVLHTDTQVLPRARAAWAAWNYRAGGPPEQPVSVTYDMNILQGLAAPETFCVSLNPTQLLARERILGRVRYEHPLASRDGVVAQARRSAISGTNRTHYCGAYWGYGFHEDGVVSARAVAAEFGSSQEVAA